jgi:hypothetical protein
MRARANAVRRSGATTTAVGSDDVEDCMCNSGYVGTIAGSHDQCSSCPIGSYKPGAGVQECTDCTDHAITASTGSTASTDCNLCEAGYFGDTPWIAGDCAVCASGTFRGASDPPEACIPCPSGSTTEEGAIAIDQCSCQAGYTGSIAADGTGVCSPCPVATYKPDNGPGACSACPAGSTTTQTGTTAITDCLCPEGAFLSGEICAPCPIGTFKTEVGSEECTTCPEGKQSATPSCYLPACCCLTVLLSHSG